MKTDSSCSRRTHKFFKVRITFDTFIMPEHSCPHCMMENMSAHELSKHMMAEHPDESQMAEHKNMSYHG